MKDLRLFSPDMPLLLNILNGHLVVAGISICSVILTVHGPICVDREVID